MYSTTNPLTRRGLTVPMGPKMKEMKRLGKIAIWSLCFATLTLSCTKVEHAESAQAQISYNVVQYTQTKAAGEYPTNVPFISTAFYLEDGKTWAANHSEAKAYIENATISYDETRTSWHDAAHSYYWPRAGKLTFFSYSPEAIKDYTKIDRNSGITITNWDVNSNQNIDIMIADVQTDQTANQTGGTYTVVPTIFRHALSKISGFTFNLHKNYAPGYNNATGKYSKDDVVFILKSIVIKNMPQKGTYSNTMPSELNIGVWNKAVDGVHDYTWYSSASETIIPYSATPMAIKANGLSPYSELYLLPQLYPEDGGPSLEITYTKRTYTGNGKNNYTDSPITASVSFYDLFASTGNRLVINRNLTFNIVFNIDSNLITWAPDQQDWDGSDFKIDF